MAPSSGVAAFLAWPSTFLGPRHRWVSLVLGVAMQLCAGALYSVTAWGVPLRDRCGWNDGELTLAETVGTLGIYLALHNGLAVDKHGARVVVVAASAALFVGGTSSRPSRASAGPRGKRRSRCTSSVKDASPRSWGRSRRT